MGEGKSLLLQRRMLFEEAVPLSWFVLPQSENETARLPMADVSHAAKGLGSFLRTIS